MKNKKDHSQLLCVFKDTIEFTKTLLSEFESIFDNKRITEEIPKVEVVYMEVIIINLAKLFSKLKCDKFGIIQLKKISSKKIVEKIREIEKSHKDIIGKIISNRNKLIAHTDKNFYELCFSDDTRKKMEEAYHCDLSKMSRAISKDKERYTQIDLKNDSPEIKELIEKMDKIWLEVLMFYYHQK